MLLRLFLFGASVVLAAQSSTADEQRLDAALAPIRAKHELPAIAAAVVKGGRFVAVGATGTRVLGRSIPVAVADRFHIGSITKSMTATLAGALIERGQLAWTSSIGDVLGQAIPNLKPMFAAITLEQLLSHTSGLPSDNEEIGALYFGSAAYAATLGEYRRRIISDWGTKHEPDSTGGKFQYSNLGFIIVGAMIEQASGEAWEALIQSQIFAPLGLRSAGLGPQATMGLYDAPVGHDVDDKTGAITPRPWGPSADAPAVIGPAGIAHMSVSDLARWGAWNAGEGRRAPAILKPETLKRLHAPHVFMAIPDPKPGSPKSGAYGFAWGLVKFDWSAKPLLTHNGSNSMNLATVLADVENDLAIAVATNFPGQKADEALLEVTQMLYEKFAPNNPRR